MTEDDMATAAGLLHGAWDSGTAIEALPGSCQPATAAEALAIQDLVVAQSGQAVAGWKILTLPDGTLAGADLTLPVAVANLIRLTGASPARSLSMASSQPAFLLGQQHRFGRLEAGRQAHMVLLDQDFRLQRVWSGDGWLEG